MIESGEFKLLNVAYGKGKRIPWSSSDLPRLWVYHLNYCDFVNLDLAHPEDHRVLLRTLLLMVDWCRQNSTGREVGWEPYPLSLRIVNWLKFLLRNASRLEAIGQEATLVEILSSLKSQVLVLERTLEFHLRANHLLKNIKALIFAGALLETRESNRWWTRGADLLAGQLREQVLPDGGHFERSTMYHAEVLEDLLDLETLTTASGRTLSCVSALSEGVERMAEFLSAMLHPDGEIPLFNDSAFGIAPHPRELLARAGKCNADFAPGGMKVLPDTGYATIREPITESFLVFDCGPVGPDYQPGHAHCDVLSYELSLDGQRVVVDTGVSRYEPGPERHYERSTAAHNTIRIDGEEQAEIWASFRIGRRPKVGPIKSGQTDGFRFIRGAHYGYGHLGVVHSRQIILCPRNRWVVVDCLDGEGSHQVESFVHFHPDVQVENWSDSENPSLGELRKRYVIRSDGHRYFLLALNTGTLALKDAWYSPEFGRRERQTVIHWRWQGPLPARLVYALGPAEEDFPSVSFKTGHDSIMIDNVHIPLS